MPNSAFGFSSRANSSCERARPAQAHLHRAAHLGLAGDAAVDFCQAVHSSNCMTMSLSSTRWICMLTSGVSSSLSPLTGDWKATPCSLTLALAPSDQTWKPPLSVRIGRVQPSKRCRPPKRAQHVEPGPQPQVEGVAEDDLGAHRLERLRHHALDAAVGADRHEDRRLDDAVAEARGGRAAPSPSVARTVEVEHRRIVAAALSRRLADEDAAGRVPVLDDQQAPGRIDGDAGRRAERAHACLRCPAVDPDLRRALGRPFASSA